MEPARNSLRLLFLLTAYSISAMSRAEEPALSEAKRSGMDADLVFVNGNIYTVNEKRPHGEAIAVRKDRIVFVVSNEDAKKFTGDNTRLVDLDERTVVPGLTDSHCHIFGI